ncbi:MAG: Gfo/Idh/MocA family protein, partial [Cryomorphaceae bacterium]
SFGNAAPARYRNRLESPELAGGVTLDMGVYPISTACYLMDSLPEKVQSMAHICETGVDDTANYLLRFPGGRFASLSASFNLKMDNVAHIYGSKGSITMPDFHQGDHFEISLYGEDNQIASTETVRPEQNPNGFVHEVEEVRDCIAAGLTESKLMPIDETIGIMEIMDAMRAEWGLKYPFE